MIEGSKEVVDEAVDDRGRKDSDIEEEALIQRAGVSALMYERAIIQFFRESVVLLDDIGGLGVLGCRYGTCLLPAISH